MGPKIDLRRSTRNRSKRTNESNVNEEPSRGYKHSRGIKRNAVHRRSSNQSINNRNMNNNREKSPRSSLSMNHPSQPTVIRLDVSDSSSSDESIGDERCQNRNKNILDDSIFSQKPSLQEKEINRGILSDSDSDTTLPDKKPIHFNKLNSTQYCMLDRESDEDIFSVNYNAIRNAAMKCALEETKIATEHNQNEDSNQISDFSEEDNDDEKSEDNEHKLTQMKSLANIDSYMQKGDQILNHRMSRKAKAADAKLQAFIDAQSIQVQILNESNDCSLICISDEEDFTVSCIRIRWGMEYYKVNISKGDKFLRVYEYLAEKHGTSISQIVLSFNGKVISPDQSITKMRLRATDFIDGGKLQSRNEIDSKIYDENELTVKLQSSKRKDSLTFQVNKFDKFLLVMQKYADMKKESLSHFKFYFDGEKLDASDTAEILDLEGGECIDVYEV